MTPPTALPSGLTRISGDGDNGVWETSGFSGAANPITIHYNGGIGGLTVR